MTGLNRSATEPAHLPALDGLRGLAFAMVFFFHFGESREHVGFARKVFYRLTDMGGHGVEVFFVLSGFLITGILFDTRGRDDRYTRFYGRRSLRIFPLYYAFLFGLFVVLRPFGASWPGYTTLLTEQGWYWSYLQNWKIAFTGWPQFSCVDHFWSLAVEEQFYLFWPLLVFSVARVRVVQIASALIVVSPLVRGVLVYRFPQFTNFAGESTLTRMDSLAMGALLAALLRGEGGRALVERYALPATVASAVAVALVTVRPGAWGRGDGLAHVVGLTFFSALTMAVIALAAIVAPGGRVAAVLVSRPLRALGKISYGGYVFHYPVLVVLAPRIQMLLPPGGVRAALEFVICAAVTLALSAASWVFFEKPILRLRGIFEPARVASVAPPAGPG